MLTITDDKIVSDIPDSVEIRSNSFGLTIVSTKNFSTGDVIYFGKYLLVEETNLAENYLLIIDDKVYLVNKFTHFVKHGIFRKVYGFDSFTNHSCDPTTKCDMLDETNFCVKALKNINIGDELTCDYDLCEYECDGHQIENCQCGSNQCRKLIKGFKYATDCDKLKLLKKCCRTSF